jgi:nucleoid-associated protein YgaU
MIARRLAWIVLAVFMLPLTAGCGKRPPPVKGPIQSGDYKVLAGDDLSNIALRAYGDMNCWQSLLNANPQVGTRPRFRLETGETLAIPEYGKLDRRLPKSVFPTSLPADYIVMPGDSLHFIAKGCYGDRELWPLIYEANRDTLSERVKRDTRKIVAGQVLHIPARPAAAPAAAESTAP